MDHHSRSTNYEDNVGIPEDLRCKRSDGKQWRCNAMSMPDKTVCEKHYIQAKKRAANSALRANMKKKRKSLGDSDDYMDGKNDDEDTPPMSLKSGEFSASVSGRKHMDMVPKSHTKYSLESPPLRNSSTRNPKKLNDDLERDIGRFDENQRSLHKSLTPSAVESSRNKTPRNFEEHSDGSTESSYGAGGITCHQCRKNDRSRVVWCMKCDKRGYCDYCASKWYPDISLDEIQQVCPTCRGTCNCKMCLRSGNLIKVRIREIGGLDKLQHLYSLLSSVLPVIKRIHSDQSFELELETRLYGTKVDIPRAKLNADEQMCCNCCRIPIVDYHRHCTNCTYDLCLACCRDLRQESLVGERGESLEIGENQIMDKSQEGSNVSKQSRSSRKRMNLADRFPDWRASSDGAIPCPPIESGGCACPSLALRRIFKMNWVAKLVKNVEEMVSGCKVYEDSYPSSDSKMCQFANREEGNDNFLYCPVSEDIKFEGIGPFQKHWVRGEPVIVKQVYNSDSSSSWDPVNVWKGIRETTDEKTKDENRIVKAIDCLNCSEVEIQLGQFIKGYSEGRIHENGWPEMLKLKDWPSPSASEEFLLYQRSEFISKLPFLEYIHSKWGLLNVAAKLPHYSLQNDVGPRIFISYGIHEELGRGDSLTNLHTNMRDMVYLLMHTCEVKLKGWQRAKIDKIQKTSRESESTEPLLDGEPHSDEISKLPDSSPHEHGTENFGSLRLSTSKDEIMEDQILGETEIATGEERKGADSKHLDRDGGDAVSEIAPAGAVWDVFRRQDVPKLIEYLKVHREEFNQSTSLPTAPVMNPLYDLAVFLNRDHKRKLKEEFGIEPWTFEQCLGEAVFIPAGCPFQVRNLQSTVQLALDFLSPESLEESIRLAEEIRCLPYDHEAKHQMLELGKMSLYAASTAIREVQKLALDPKAGLGFEDPNLTCLVSENLGKMIRQRQITCV